MSEWDTKAIRALAPTIRALGKDARFNTPYGEAEPATYGLVAEALEWAADALGQCQAELSGLKLLHDAVTDSQRVRIEQLEAALRKYGDHTYECSVGQPNHVCDCGFNQLLVEGS